MIALARRYRPKQFADLLVQDHVAAVLRGAVARGRVGHGYLLTGLQLDPPGRMLETSLPGVFAVGDVRDGPSKRVAAAVGEGSVVIQQVHQFLEEEGLRPAPAGGQNAPS